MRQIRIILYGLLLTSCNYERVFISDVDKLTLNRLENNRIEIAEIKKELKQAKIDQVKENIDLINRLDRVHESILKLSDSIESFNKGIAARNVTIFISNNFNDLRWFNKVPLELNEDTPRPLLKLHLATFESFLIRDARDNYEGNSLKFDQMIVHIVPSKTIVKNGEKITGQLFVVAKSRYESTKDMISKMTLNGQEIKADKVGWKFEIQPIVKGTGLIDFELKGEAIFKDPRIKTVVKGNEIIHVQN
jgi:hypothetical protein